MAPPIALPYSETLHYPTCGCGWDWQRSDRAADRVDERLLAAFEAFQDKSVLPSRPLNVAYMLPHHNITGGMKCLVEHIRLLRARGHRTIAVHRSDTAHRAMPPWTEVEADRDVVCKLHQRLNDVYDVQEIDVVVVGIFHQVAELLLGVPAPVLYWEQGHEWLFGDPVRFQTAHNYIKQDQLFHMVMQLPVALASVSTAVQDILKQEFGRDSLLIPNSVDCRRFRPGSRSANPVLARDTGKPKWRVLLVGNPTLQLKGFDVAIAALQAVHCVLPIHVTWICQVEPTVAALPALASATFELTAVVKPSQSELPALYRGHDVFLFTSRYEAWGMPVMEAMASGLPVVTTDCLGVRSFARHGSNCLLANANDAASCARLVVQVLSDSRLRSKLQRNARATALKYTPDQLLNQLEAVLYSLVSQRKPLFQIRKTAVEQIRTVCMWASTACATPRPSSTTTTAAVTAAALAASLPTPMPIPLSSSQGSILQAVRLLPQGSLSATPTSTTAVPHHFTLQQQIAVLQGWQVMNAMEQAVRQPQHALVLPATLPISLNQPHQQLLLGCQPTISAQLGGVMGQPLATFPHHQLQHMLHTLWLQGQQQQQQPPG